MISPRLRGIIIVKTRDEIETSGVAPMRGLDVRNIPLLNTADFEDVVVPYLDRELTVGTLKKLQRDIILYCRSRNRPLVDVILPEQTVQNDVIQLWFLEGKVGTLTVQPVGHKWFKDKLIIGQVHLHSGDSVDSQRLLSDLNWINRNPFLQVDAEFKQGAQLGQSDVVLLPQERFPLRLYTGYEDSGTKLTGEERVLGGFNWGNAFGLGHQLNYQYMTDTDFEFVQAHSGSYLVPLPWRHSLTVFGSYVDARANLQSLSSSFNQHGFDYQISFRYDVPLPSLGKYRHDVTLGYDHKVSNNNLLFGGSAVIRTEPAIDQFELGYNGLLSDTGGQTSFGLEGFISPGGLTRNNTDTSFGSLRSGARASYEYVRLNLERDTRLARDFSWILKITGQFVSNRLLPSEELGIGGYDTVRGYDERTASGDEGWIISNEFRTPPFSVLRFAPLHWTTQLKSAGRPGARPSYPDQLQLLSFCDYGTTHTTKAQLGEDRNVELASAGVGLRYVITRYLSVRLDYGWQLLPSEEKSVSSEDSRGHVAVLLSY
ncbi:MAG TPA: ShlB/FhaC/HecB family hemolysin secretion/activation protein [Verrucomicrobiae bacterium]|nr:ShlB/FhaC/HecB family hemolysin secretion/activation protein [Verrucomicrobiae bacterium]